MEEHFLSGSLHLADALIAATCIEHAGEARGLELTAQGACGTALVSHLRFTE